VISPDGDDVYISARSIGVINVQLIMEKLGGGGNQSTAGCMIKTSTRDQVLERLKAAIDAYLESSTPST
jgi:c-di-AMP phosphodiesterase-like protein